MKEEIAGFRKSFEDKMVEELDEHKAKIGVLQQLIRNKEEAVLEKMKEKSEIEAALDKLVSIGNYISYVLIQGGCRQLPVTT